MNALAVCGMPPSLSSIVHLKEITDSPITFKTWYPMFFVCLVSCNCQVLQGKTIHQMYSRFGFNTLLITMAAQRWFCCPRNGWFQYGSLFSFRIVRGPLIQLVWQHVASLSQGFYKGNNRTYFSYPLFWILCFACFA